MKCFACSEPWHVQNLRNFWNPAKHLRYIIFLRTFCKNLLNLSVYAEPEEQSEPCQACIWCSVFLMKPDIFRTLIYSQSWHILKLRYVQNPVKCIRWSTLFRTLKYIYLGSSYIQNFNIFVQNSRHSILRIFKIQFTLVYLTPNILRAQGKFRNLSNMYDGLFSTEPCITLLYSELRAYSGLCQKSLMKNLFTTLCNPSIFRTAAYSVSKAYSEYCQTSDSCRISKIGRFIKNSV